LDTESIFPILGVEKSVRIFIYQLSRLFNMPMG